MAILYKKYQDGDKTPFIYDSAEEASKDKIFKGIPLKTVGIDGKEITRCFGAVKDVNAVCGFNSREILEKTAKEHPETLKQVGRVDNEIDSWDLKSVAKKSNDIDFLYDRQNPDNDLSNEMLDSLPLGAIIATGDARGVYLDKNLPNRVSRHTITVAGHTKSGKPIIYDLGKFYEGIPKKYLNDINFIIAPKGSKSKTPVSKSETPVNKPKQYTTKYFRKPTPWDTKQRETTFYETNPSNYGQMVEALLSQVFGGKYRR